MFRSRWRPWKLSPWRPSPRVGTGNTSLSGTAFAVLHFEMVEASIFKSKSLQPLGRYFPEVAEALAEFEAKHFVLDGEIAVPEGRGFSFDALLPRIHPAASRVKRLAAETPAIYIVFDLLAVDDGKALLSMPLRERRARLERF